MTKSIMRIVLLSGLILLIPLIVQLTIGTGVDGQGFNWKPADFIVMGVLLFSVGLAFAFIPKKFTTSFSRVMAVIIIIVVFLLVWAELAVGIFGSPFAGS